MRKNSFLSKINKVFLKDKALDSNFKSCSDCGDNNNLVHNHKGKKYKCQICNRMIHEENSLEHIKAEEYIVGLIKKDHSHWQDKEPTCQECVDYYRKLVKETEI
ncbi:MAG: hypothetical protein ABIH08_06395 [Candidatus Omnitrophota bacterium]